MRAATVNSDLVELSFKGRRRERFENPDRMEYRTGEHLIVQAERGEDMGVVVLSTVAPGKKVDERPATGRRILRRATWDDLARVSDLRRKEDDASAVARKKILEHRLAMKLVDVEFQHDGNRITFFFTAEQRVDFRELVKDLAAVFRTRIELRQIGVRDEAGRHGGVGVCGRPLCCTTWIREFQPITLRMAKDQNLSLSPSKLSGVCGRLKCCLRYELEFYHEAQKTYPRLGARFVFQTLDVEVVKVDIFREGVHVMDAEKRLHWVALEEIPEIPREDRLSFKRKKSAGGQGGCGNTQAGGCGAGRGEPRSGGGCGSSGGCGTSAAAPPTNGTPREGGAGGSARSGGGCGGCGRPPRPTRPQQRRRPGPPRGGDPQGKAE